MFFSNPSVLLTPVLRYCFAQTIPNELQGRVWGLVSLLTQTGMIIAFASCGVIADAVFEPMFQDSGLLTNSIGRIIGIGQGRGIGFMLILSGIGMILSMLVLGRSRGSKTINNEPKQ